MLNIISSRIGSSLAAIFGASLVSFLLLRVLPGDPVRLIVGLLSTEEAEEAVREKLGLDLPLWQQYGQFITDFFTGDWGFSYSAGQPVMQQMASRLPASLELGFYAFLLAFLGAIVLGLYSTYRPQKIVDGTVRGLSIFGLGMPPFWLGLILLIVFFEALDWFPGPGGRLEISTLSPPAVTGFYTFDALIAGQFTTFWEAARHLVLPAISLGLAPFGFLVRLLRANLLDTTREPYIVVVRSKGVGLWLTHWRHALPNAFLPTLTASGLLFAQLLGGSVLVEKVFDWPGVGALVVNSILRQDYSVVQAFIMISAVIYVAVNFIVDILYGVVDPRVRIPKIEG